MVELIAQAQAGMTHKELRTLLRVAVQNTLTELVVSNTVGRHLLPNRLSLYVSQDPHQGAAQFQRRLNLLEKADETVLPPDPTLTVSRHISASIPATARVSGQFS